MHEKVEFRVISNPTRDELEQLYEIEVNAHEAPWSFDSLRDCFTDNTRCIGLYLKNKLIGFSFICSFFDESELYTIGVSRKYQGLGFGKQLLLRSLQMCKELGALKCFLEVRVSNEVALHIYDYYGFEITGTRKNYYPATSRAPAESAYTMACDLTAIPDYVNS